MKNPHNYLMILQDRELHNRLNDKIHMLAHISFPYQTRWVEINNAINSIKSISNMVSNMYLSLLLVDLPLIFPSETQTEHEGYPLQTYPEEKTIPFSPPLYQFCEVE